MKQAIIAFLVVATCHICTRAFLVAPSKYSSPTLSTGKATSNLETTPIGDGQSSMVAIGAGFLLGGAVAMMRPNARGGKTAARYTTENIVPALSWVKANLKEDALGPGDLITLTLGGCDVCIGKTDGGKLFAVGDKAPPTGTSLSIGGEVEGETVRDGQYGSAFNVYTGEVMEWCPTPPVLGNLVGTLMGGPQMLAVFDIRTSFFGKEIEVLVDLNAKKAYEANYWKGVLDAQGKDDGTYY